MSRTAREVPAAERARRERATARERSLHVRPRRRPRSAEEEASVSRVAKNRVLVSGRILFGGRRVWDVYRIEGDGVVLYHSGCGFQAEAMCLATDAMLGRKSISLSGVRNLFGSERDRARDGKSQILATTKALDIVQAGDRPMRWRELPNGDLVGEGMHSRVALAELEKRKQAQKPQASS